MVIITREFPVMAGSREGTWPAPQGPASWDRPDLRGWSLAYTGASGGGEGTGASAAAAAGGGGGGGGTTGSSGPKAELRMQLEQPLTVVCSPPFFTRVRAFFTDLQHLDLRLLWGNSWSSAVEYQVIIHHQGVVFQEYGPYMVIITSAVEYQVMAVCHLIPEGRFFFLADSCWCGHYAIRVFYFRNTVHIW